jgi:tryptophan synthase alpha chain
MKRRLAEMFDGLSGKRAALVAYATAFYPDRDTSARVITTLLEGGADAVEIGIPFSDPVLDGPIIQRSSSHALGAGATTRGVLDLVDQLRGETEKPLLLMSYYNPVLKYGLDCFARDAVSAGADAVVIPDLPVEEMHPLKRACFTAGLDTVAFCSLTTSPERMRVAGSMSSGFLYCVSLLGTTGPREEVSPNLAPFLQKIRENVSCPVAVGLGISTPKQCSHVAGLVEAVIVGSALVKLVGTDGESLEPLQQAVKAFAGGMGVGSGLQI